MIAALFFGVYHHFVMVSPDHVSHLPAGPARMQAQFAWSATLLAVLEAIAVAYGVLRLRGLHAAPGRSAT